MDGTQITKVKQLCAVNWTLYRHFTSHTLIIRPEQRSQRYAHISGTAGPSVVLKKPGGTASEVCQTHHVPSGCYQQTSPFAQLQKMDSHPDRSGIQGGHSSGRLLCIIWCTIILPTSSRLRHPLHCPWRDKGREKNLSEFIDTRKERTRLQQWMARRSVGNNRPEVMRKCQI